MMPITLLYAGILGLLAVLLANLVLYVRLRGATQPNWRGEATVRVQANFVENVPMALILLFLLEHAGVQAVALHTLGSALVACRVLHAWGMARNPGANYPRLIGAQGTFLLLSIMGMIAVYLWLIQPTLT
jgi:uncharacterized membrane protein YecN with MAPEG domain